MSIIFEYRDYQVRLCCYNHIGFLVFYNMHKQRSYQQLLFLHSFLRNQIPHLFISPRFVIFFGCRRHFFYFSVSWTEPVMHIKEKHRHPGIILFKQPAQEPAYRVVLSPFYVPAYFEVFFCFIHISSLILPQPLFSLPSKVLL